MILLLRRYSIPFTLLLLFLASVFALTQHPRFGAFPLLLNTPALSYLLVGMLVIFVCIGGGMMGLAIYIVEMLTRPKRRADFIPLNSFALDLPAERITFSPIGGEHTVNGFYIPYPNATTTIIICPGYQRTLKDILGMCKHLWQAGHNVLAFEYFGHGEVTGTRITLGHREIDDFMGAVNYVKKRAPRTRIGALGYSMGAAVTIMGSALANDVEVLVADSAFASSWRAVECAFYRTLHIPFKLPHWIMSMFYRITDSIFWLRSGYHFHHNKPLEAIRHIAPRPILFIHGLSDTTVYPDDAKLLYKAASGPKDIWLIPGVEHIKGYFADSNAYVTRVVNFFDTHLTRSLQQEKIEERQVTFPQHEGDSLEPKRKRAGVHARRTSRMLRLRYAQASSREQEESHRLGLAYGNFIYRQRWLIIICWIVVLAVSLPFARSVASLLNNSGYTISGSESNTVDDLLTSKLHHPVTQVLVLFQSPTAQVNSPEYQREVHDVAAQSSHIAGVTQITQGGIGQDGHTTILALGFNSDKDSVAQHIPELRRSLLKARGNGPAQITLTGDAVVANEIELDTQSDTEYAEMIGMPLTLLALMVVFGTVIAGLMPLLLAGVTVPVTLAIIYVIASHIETNIFVQSVTSIIGLGLSIDYSLFIVRRFREELAKGFQTQYAVALTVATAGEAILFSGTTVVIGFAGLLFIGIQIMTSFGIGGIAVASVAVIAALTLLPAMLGVLGTRVNALRLPFLSRPAVALSHGASPQRKRFWHTWALLVMKRPVLIIVAVIVILVAMGWPARTLNPALPGASALPATSEARHGLDLLQAQFPALNDDPISIIVRTNDGQSIMTQQNLQRLDTVTQWIARQNHVTGVVGLTQLPQTPGVAAIEQRQLFSLYSTGAYQGMPALKQLVSSTTAGDTTLLTIKVDTKAASSEDQALLDHLRSIDPTTKQGLTTLVGGSRVTNLDFNRTLYSSFIRTLIFILIATYFLLLITFRSLVLPLKAILMNVLSISASYGALVYVFQQGHFQQALGFTSDGSVDRFIPILMFCTIFGLSMDYEVFLLTRIREEWLRTHDNRASVALGVEKTGGVITNAALLFIIVSASFTLTSLVVTKELGLGITVAVLVDATIIRSLLVPASMQLMGKWNWWLPGQELFTNLVRKRRRGQFAGREGKELTIEQRSGRTFITQSLRTNTAQRTSRTITLEELETSLQQRSRHRA